MYFLLLIFGEGGRGRERRSRERKLSIFFKKNFEMMPSLSLYSHLLNYKLK